MEPLDLDNSETHPLFPSGEWEGFYTDDRTPGISKHPMQISLFFENGTVSGGGGDDVGAFAWQGTYDTQAMICQMTKCYFMRHTVDYNGRVDENGIWGKWMINPWVSGGFHIWPKKREEEENQESEKLELELKLKTPVPV